MGNNISYTLCSLFFSIMLIIVFFSKKRLQSVENKIYSWLIITNFFGLIIQISCGVFTPMTSGSISSMFFTKMYFIYLLTWLFLFVFYTFFGSKKDNNNNIFYSNVVLSLLVLIYSICFIILVISPIDFYNSNGIIYTYGLSVDCMFFISSSPIVSVLPLISTLAPKAFRQFTVASISFEKARFLITLFSLNAPKISARCAILLLGGAVISPHALDGIIFIYIIIHPKVNQLLLNSLQSLFRLL